MFILPVSFIFVFYVNELFEFLRFVFLLKKFITATVTGVNVLNF